MDDKRMERGEREREKERETIYSVFMEMPQIAWKSYHTDHQTEVTF